MKTKAKSNSKKRKIAVVAGLCLIVLAAVLIFITVYGDKFDRSHKPGSQDSALAGEYVSARADKINVPGNKIVDKSYDSGCASSAAGSGLNNKTEKRCTYRHIIVYSSVNDVQAFLLQLRTSLDSDGWQVNGQVKDIYYRYDGPVGKNRSAQADIIYYSGSELSSGEQVKTRIDLDISIAKDYDKDKAEVLGSVKQLLKESPSTNIVIVDIGYDYFWDLY